MTESPAVSSAGHVDEAATASSSTDRRSTAVSRRTMLKAIGGAAALAGAGAVGVTEELRSKAPARPALQLASVTPPKKSYTLAGTDGFISMPVEAADMAPYFPDSYATEIPLPSGVSVPTGARAKYTTYAFGFRNVTEFDPDNPANPNGSVDTSQHNVNEVKFHVQASAPLMYTQVGQDLRLTLFNLGFQNRPDLFDSHTIHFHGFANQISYFDGVPDASLSVPPGRSLNYRYLPADAGTYMYHCHVEDVEHVQMGMNGMVFIAPRLGLNYAYEDPSTRFDRQFSIHLSEMWAQGHFNDDHTQDSDWTDFYGTFRLMNGRAYPDTIKPSMPAYPTGQPGDPAALTSSNVPSGMSNYDAFRLRYQPQSALVQGESGETILLRFSHLGYEEHSLVLPNLPFMVVGRDAKFQGANRDGYYSDYYNGTRPDRLPDPRRANIEVTTTQLEIGPGESRDLLIKLPVVTAPTVFTLYDRQYGYTNPTDGSAATGYGGMRTEIHVFPANKLARPSTDEVKAALAGQDGNTISADGAVLLPNMLKTGAAGHAPYWNPAPTTTPAGNGYVWRDGSPIVQLFPGQLFAEPTN